MGIQHYRPPRLTWWQVIGGASFWAIPLITTLAALAASLMYIPGILLPVPLHWPAMVMIYWACYRPEWQPLWMVFILGLCIDILMATPVLGMTAFIAVALASLLRSQHTLLLSLPFWALWPIVGVSLILWRGSEALLYGMITGHAPGLMTWMGSALLSALAFPLVAMLLSPLRRAGFQF